MQGAAAPRPFCFRYTRPACALSREAIMKLVDFAKQAQIKVLFVQVYHSGQAWFPSKMADDSPYVRCRQAF